jgi:predicted DsbA family dithiol-disulfide isomerase
MATATKTTRTRKAKTAEDLKADLAKARAALAALEQRAYAGELDGHVQNSAIVKEFIAIREKVKGVSDIAILASIGKAVGIKRVEVSIKPVATRKPKAKK